MTLKNNCKCKNKIRTNVQSFNLLDAKGSQNQHQRIYSFSKKHLKEKFPKESSPKFSQKRFLIQFNLDKNEKHNALRLYKKEIKIKNTRKRKGSNKANHLNKNKNSISYKISYCIKTLKKKKLKLHVFYKIVSNKCQKST